MRINKGNSQVWKFFNPTYVYLAFYLSTCYKQADFEVSLDGNVIIPFAVRQEIGCFIYHERNEN